MATTSAPRYLGAGCRCLVNVGSVGYPRNDLCSTYAIEEKCLDILALDWPVATDLRRVVTILKTNAQIERLGDLATNIAEDIVYLKTAEIVRHEQ